MPYKPKKPCSYPGCPALVESGSRCEKHKRDRQYDRDYDRTRGTAHQRGYTSTWRRYTRMYLRAHPLCMCPDCAALPVPLPANVVDHIVPHKGDMELFWDPENHQSMSKSCHDRKTAREDGGFGRGRGGQISTD